MISNPNFFFFFFLDINFLDAKKFEEERRKLEEELEEERREIEKEAREMCEKMKREIEQERKRLEEERWRLQQRRSIDEMNRISLEMYKRRLEEERLRFEAEKRKIEEDKRKFEAEKRNFEKKKKNFESGNSNSNLDEEIDLEFELDTLKREAQKSTQDFLDFIYKTHPPKDTNNKLMKGQPQKKALLNALRHYHPDKQGTYHENWRKLTEEITKILTLKLQFHK